jgi:hypothetical protein
MATAVQPWRWAAKGDLRRLSRQIVRGIEQTQVAGDEKDGGKIQFYY